MTHSPLRHYWDANVFLAYLNGEAARRSDLDAYLEDAQAGRIEVVTSTVSIVEVAFASSERSAGAKPEVLERIEALWRPPVKLSEMSPLVAETARTLIRAAVGKGWSLKPVDAIHLATAQRMTADVLQTYEGRQKRDQWTALTDLMIEEPAHPEPKLL